MPALVRRLLIWAAADGLVLQAHGPSEHHKAIQIDYKNRQIRELRPSATNTGVALEPSASRGTATPLEAHGVIGLLSLASSTFLIAITKREQVAQIFGKPIYVVTDVALVPLSSQGEADKAISASVASKSRRANETAPSTDSDSDSDLSDDGSGENEAAGASVDGEGDDPHDVEPETPMEDGRPEQTRTTSSTSIARDVIANRGQYGRFASEWFSRQGWGVGKSGNNAAASTSSSSSVTSKKETPGDAKEGNTATAATVNAEPPQEAAQKDESRDKEQAVAENSIADALPKILRSTKMILTSRSYFFSYEFDLTRRLMLLNGTCKPPARESLDPLVSSKRWLIRGKR